MLSNVRGHYDISAGLCALKSSNLIGNEKADIRMKALKSASLFPNIECFLKIYIIHVTTANLQ
jgi:hypothetical protein